MGIARLALGLVLAGAAFAAAAQQMYRWTDQNGRTHITDTPPPAGTKNVRMINPGTSSGGSAAKPAAAVPYQLDLAMKQYPVTLFTSPGCADPCATARDLLNRRGVPFSEKQVWEEEGNAELQKLSGNTRVPTIQVGQSVYAGFERAAYDSLLDSAGYPREGVLPSRAQAAPGRPEGYVPPEEREVKAEPVKPEPKPTPSGPYAPR